MPPARALFYLLAVSHSLDLHEIAETLWLPPEQVIALLSSDSFHSLLQVQHQITTLAIRIRAQGECEGLPKTLALIVYAYKATSPETVRRTAAMLLTLGHIPPYAPKDHPPTPKRT